MRHALGQIPIIGYIARWFISLVLLPRKLSVMHHQIQDLKKELESQQGITSALGLKVLELKDKNAELNIRKNS